MFLINTHLISALVSKAVRHTFLEKLLRQISTVLACLSSRPDVPEPVLFDWQSSQVFASNQKLNSPKIRKEDVCDSVGCESLTAPSLKCARCGERLYCNKQCQKRHAFNYLTRDNSWRFCPSSSDSLLLRVPNSDWKFHKAQCQQKP